MKIIYQYLIKTITFGEINDSAMERSMSHAKFTIQMKHEKKIKIRKHVADLNEILFIVNKKFSV